MAVSTGAKAVYCGFFFIVSLIIMILAIVVQNMIGSVSKG